MKSHYTTQQETVAVLTLSAHFSYMHESTGVDCFVFAEVNIMLRHVFSMSENKTGTYLS